MIAKSLKCPDCGAEIQVKEDATKWSLKSDKIIKKIQCNVTMQMILVLWQ